MRKYKIKAIGWQFFKEDFSFFENIPNATYSKTICLSFLLCAKQVQNVCDVIAAYTILENNINFVICYNKLYEHNTK